MKIKRRYRILCKQKETRSKRPNIQSKCSTGIEVEYHSVEEVRKYIKDANVDYDEWVGYDEEPKLTGKISMGKVSQKYLDDALETLNMVRYIAGVPNNVVLNEEYIEQSQAGLWCWL